MSLVADETTTSSTPGMTTWMAFTVSTREPVAGVTVSTCSFSVTAPPPGSGMTVFGATPTGLRLIGTPTTVSDAMSDSPVLPPQLLLDFDTTPVAWMPTAPAVALTLATLASAYDLGGPSEVT